jgi:predicted CoA-binding protein
MMEEVFDPWSDSRVAHRILRSFHTWAVVGCSSNPRRASHGVSRYLLRSGYEVVPVNPNEDQVHGLQAYPDLLSVPSAARESIEVVDIFRRPDLVMPHVEEAIEIGAKAIWMQLGVWNLEAAERAAHAGLLVVMNRCPAIDHPAMSETAARRRTTTSGSPADPVA